MFPQDAIEVPRPRPGVKRPSGHHLVKPGSGQPLDGAPSELVGERGQPGLKEWAREGKRSDRYEWDLSNSRGHPGLVISKLSAGAGSGRASDRN